MLQELSMFDGYGCWLMGRLSDKLMLCCLWWHFVVVWRLLGGGMFWCPLRFVWRCFDWTFWEVFLVFRVGFLCFLTWFWLGGWGLKSTHTHAQTQLQIIQNTQLVLHTYSVKWHDKWWKKKEDEKWMLETVGKLSCSRTTTYSSLRRRSLKRLVHTELSLGGSKTMGWRSGGSSMTHCLKSE